MYNAFKYLIIFGLTVFCFSSCELDKYFDYDDDKLTEEEWQEILETDSLISVSADSIFKEINPIEGWSGNLEKYKEFEWVEEAYLSGNSLIVRYKKAYNHSWYIEPDSVYFDSTKISLNDRGNYNLVLSNNKVCLINDLYYDTKFEYIRSCINILKQNFENKGFQVTIKDGQYGFADVNFYGSELYNYRIIYNHGHGEYECSSRYNLHWLQTGQESNGLLPSQAFPNEPDISRRIGTMTVKEDRSGEKDKLITYFKISEEYVDAKYSTNEFPSNSIIYLTNCHSFNSNNNLPEVFNNKGVCAVVGWNSQQGLGGYHGFLLYNSMLSFDINLSTAFLTDYIIDIPPVMSHGCTFLGWEIDQCNLLNISACVDYYPDSGGSVKFNLENNSNFPSLNTSIITNITKISAQAGGTITDDGGSQISEKGVCWSTLQNPTIIDSHTSDGTGMGSFTSQITGLTPNTPYIVRAYATNSSGTAYGDEKSFTTLPEAPPSGGLVPLAVGNYWIYQPEGLPQTETASILGSQEVQGVTCFEWFAQGDTYSYLLTNKSDGVWCYGYGPYQLPPDLRYKYPVQVNDTWISYWVAPPYATTVTCLSTNASIGGYTDCILYNFYLPLAYHSMQTSSFVFQDKIDSFEGLNKTSSGFDIYDYYIPGIGMVGWETYLDGTLFVKAVLVDYQFNQ